MADGDVISAVNGGRLKQRYQTVLLQFIISFFVF